MGGGGFDDGAALFSAGRRMADGGGVGMLRDLFGSEEGRNRLEEISRLASERVAEEAPPPPSQPRLPEAIPDPGRAFNYSDEQLVSRSAEGSPDSLFNEIASRSRPAPPEGGSIARVGMNDMGDENAPANQMMSGVRLPSMPDTSYRPPERNPYAPIIGAVAKALEASNDRLPSGHLKNFGFSGVLGAAGAGTAEGLRGFSSDREESRKDYDKKLAGERLSEGAAMARLPYLEMTVADAERAKAAKKLAEREEWRYLGPSAINQGKSIFLNQRSGETEERDVGVAAKPVNRVLSSPEQNRLDVASRAVNSQHAILDDFDDKYGGSVFETWGELKNWAAKNIPGMPEDQKKAATWWQQYQDFKSDVRHGRFGAALTRYEIGEWAKQDIQPGMQPDMIRARLEKQFEVIQGALQRKAQSLMKQGYSPEAIEAQLGFSPQQSAKDFPYFQRKAGTGGTEAPAAPSGGVDVLAQAKAARAAGAPRDAVIQMLKSKGVKFNEGDIP